MSEPAATAIADITLDLDDTLWPIAPAIAAADQALLGWLAEYCPAAAAEWPLARMHALRDEVWLSQPDLGHDFTRLRLLTIERMLAPHGLGPTAVEAAFEAFYAARNRVELYPEVAAVLERLARRFPLLALSNGNACLRRIGIDHLFSGAVHAREVGVAKPQPAIFQHACERAGIDPASVLHVGDHPLQDVQGALDAGLQAAWIDRGLHSWPDRPQGVRRFTDLSTLAVWLGVD
jgi:putative hydrolase of the HAD superfamily